MALNTSGSASLSSNPNKETERAMTEPRKPSWEERSQISFINEPIDFTVVEVVPEETAREKANRIWKMNEKKRQEAMARSQTKITSRKLERV
jgi:hypothetical protein